MITNNEVENIVNDSAVKSVDGQQHATVGGDAAPKDNVDGMKLATEDNDDDIDYDVSIVEQMLQACESNDMNVIQSIIQTHGTLYGCYAIPSTGMTPLMVASSFGYIHWYEYLLNDCGAPWNAIDRTYHYCAGDYATQSQHWDIVNLLVDWATRAELILGCH